MKQSEYDSYIKEVSRWNGEGMSDAHVLADIALQLTRNADANMRVRFISIKGDVVIIPLSSLVAVKIGSAFRIWEVAAQYDNYWEISEETFDAIIALGLVVAVRP